MVDVPIEDFVISDPVFHEIVVGARFLNCIRKYRVTQKHAEKVW